jgi:hypothetical protein
MFNLGLIVLTDEQVHYTSVMRGSLVVSGLVLRFTISYSYRIFLFSNVWTRPLLTIMVHFLASSR